MEINKIDETKIIEKNTLNIKIDEKFVGERGRINCSLKEKNGFWRWLGIQFVVSEKYNSGFALDLMIKDVSIADQLIKKMSSDNPLSKQVLEYLEKSYRILGENSDHTEVFKVLKD